MERAPPSSSRTGAGPDPESVSRAKTASRAVWNRSSGRFSRKRRRIRSRAPGSPAELPEGVVLEDGVHGLYGGFPLEGPPPREHLREDHPRGEEVRALVHLGSSHLLGGHVARGAHDRARRGHVGLGRGVLPAPGGVGPGQAEIQDLEDAVRREEQVLGLDVPVDDALLVGRRKAPDHLDGQADGRLGGHGPGRQAVLEGLPLQELGDGVGGAVRRGVVEDGQDVGVAEGGHGPGLVLESGATVRAAGELLGQDLDGDLAAQPLVLRPVHLPHAPGAHGREDLVGPEVRAGGYHVLTPTIISRLPSVNPAAGTKTSPPTWENARRD